MQLPVFEKKKNSFKYHLKLLNTKNQHTSKINSITIYKAMPG